jgi:hypothetical protein
MNLTTQVDLPAVASIPRCPPTTRKSCSSTCATRTSPKPSCRQSRSAGCSRDSAISDRDRRFKLADGGTIFLDEIGELPLETQVKLLRDLQEQEFEPLGSSKTIRVNVRVVAATNHDLEKQVREWKFRADLYYRLNVVPLKLPPLRERAADLPLLITFFAQKYAARLGKPNRSISNEAMEQLTAYTWPGNVRELQNVIERRDDGRRDWQPPDPTRHCGQGRWRPAVRPGARCIRRLRGNPGGSLARLTTEGALSSLQAVRFTPKARREEKIGNGSESDDSDSG